MSASIVEKRVKTKAKKMWPEGDHEDASPDRPDRGGTGLAGEGGFANESGRVSGAAEYRVG